MQTLDELREDLALWRRTRRSALEQARWCREHGRTEIAERAGKVAEYAQVRADMIKARIAVA